MKTLIRYYAILAASMFAGATSPAWAQVVYVSPDGMGDGTSWSQATSLTNALADAASASAPIWLAQGTYTNRRINLGAYGGTWQASKSLVQGTLIMLR